MAQLLLGKSNIASEAGGNLMRMREISSGFCELADALAGAGDPDEISRMRIKFPPASLAILDFPSGGWANVAKGAARLHRFVTPADLRDEADAAD